jgi:hypothetical protein
MLGKPRVNILDGGTWDIAEKRSAGLGVKLVPTLEKEGSAVVARGRQSGPEKDCVEACPSFSGFGVRVVVLKKFLGPYPGTN